ncbi:predicted protein [Chaetomium globosum CBS 148.51]|uniref:Uncharacterized protein n=1 Tax=Chaetomium globosum (strain ATCC 6205 / CBS 148.51 / DSM 1962 / NBRC 6347 / NRRL 1970) TaxID=306901 RepID=Q2HB63_CHAGB|nr:uncharacterized protein CHGG_02541 [Chaetomium globosum CBS 148.51]EAQ90606.1 predicted protein [Chaetomium globosum CBS 148.51]
MTRQTTFTDKMMPSLVGTNMVGVPQHQVSSSDTYTVDTMLNELSRQLMGHTRRYSRAANGQQRGGNAMRVSKPSSASNSPRSSTLQARRRTLIGDALRGGLPTLSPAVHQTHLPTPDSVLPDQYFYEQETPRPARPVSWHPSSQNVQQPFYAQQDANVYPCGTYGDFLASLEQFPPTPGPGSGYTSPMESFSPLSLPYSSFSTSQQQIYSPVSQPLPSVHQQQVDALASTTCSSDYAAVVASSDIPYLPLAHTTDDTIVWDHHQDTTALFSRQTAPPTPEDLAYSLDPNQVTEATSQQKQQTKSEAAQQAYQPLIHDDENDDEPEGEILYGMGLYDAPVQGKESSLHQSVVHSLLGGARDYREEADTGKGLGLKLEDAWEPPASDDENEEEEEDDEDNDGEGQDD